jgi:hypothetical protein
MQQEQEILTPRTNHLARRVRAVRVVVIQAGKLLQPRRKVLVNSGNLLAPELLRK